MIDNDTVRKVARLARIGLEEEKVPIFSDQLSRILTCFRSLDEVETDDSAALDPPSPMTPPLREDAARPSHSREAMLGNTEHGSRGVYQVPRVIE